MLKEYKFLIAAAVFTYIFLLFCINKEAFWYDAICWEEWSNLIRKNGLHAAYDADISTVNYMPLYLYVLKIYTWLAGDGASLKDTIYFLKAVPLFFEVLSVALLAALVENKEQRLFFFIVGALNIGFLYDTLFWHQVDGILAFFLLVALLFAIKKRTMLSFVFFILALNFKIQAVMLLPLLGLLWLQNITFKKMINMLLVFVVLQCLIILPFLIHGNAKNILNIVFNSYNHYEEVSKNAHNIWYLLISGSPVSVSDKLNFAGISYHHYGLMMYIGAIVILIAPITWQMIQNKSLKVKGYSTKFYVLIAALLPYVFFYFNTQMHERYFHCALIFIAWLAFVYKHWILYVFISIIYFLSLDTILRNFRLLNHCDWIYNDKFSAVLFTLGLIYLLYLWYREWQKNKHQTALNS